MAVARPSSRRAPRLRVITLALLVLLALYVYQSGQFQQLAAHAAAQIGLAQPTAQPGAIRAFFTTPTLVYPDTPQQRPSSPLLAAVLADLDAARISVDLASFDFDIPAVSDALLRAAGRGVLVRLVVDSENLDTPEVSQQTGRLQRAGIAVHFDRREPFMHNKFVVVDGNVAWMGSWNVTDNDTWRNNNNMLRFASRPIAADYTNEFEQLFDGRFGTGKSSATPYPRVRVGGAQ